MNNNDKKYKKPNIDNLNIIKSAIKMFDVLELIIERTKLTVTEASKLTGYTPSTIQRILNTLRYLDYIEQDQNTLEYYPTFKIYNLGNQIHITDTISSTAKPHMRKMSEELNETINLGILDNHRIIYLDKVLSTSPLRVDISPNTFIPLYSSALGKAIAAFSPHEYSFGNNYEKFTENTLQSDEELKEDLKDIKNQGYSLDNEEFVEGLICIGVPILNKENEAIASLSVSVPTIRFKRDSMNDYVKLLKKYTEKIESDLFKNRKS